ncbi:MAG: YciI family protein [Roseiflexaceae bacterium]|nr:YciI family protein [Roseiflexaceae bacterium]
MKYLILIYGNEAAEAAMTQAEQQASWGAHLAYAHELRAQGVMTGGEALMPTSAATSVKVRGGQTLTTHGPFAETAEQLGGFYVVDCANLDDALAWAAKNPSAQHGTIEVRPVMAV